MIFDRDASELLAYQRFLADPSARVRPSGDVGVVGRVHPPRVGRRRFRRARHRSQARHARPPAAGRGTLIERGFLLGTGYFEELEPQLEEWLARGVITAAQYRAVKDRDLPDS